MVHIVLSMHVISLYVDQVLSNQEKDKLIVKKKTVHELQHKLEQSVEDLRRAMSDWHDAHQGLALKLA